MNLFHFSRKIWFLIVTISAFIVIFISFLIIPMIEDTYTKKNPKEDFEITSKEYEIYSNALPQLISLSKERNLLVINNHTSIDWAHGGETLPLPYFFVKLQIDKNMLNKLLDTRSKSCKLENKFDKELNIVLISDEEQTQFFTKKKTDGWLDFYKKYPNSYGIIILSRIVFNRQNNHAIFYFGNQRNWLDGFGCFILLKKKTMNG